MRNLLICLFAVAIGTASAQNGANGGGSAPPKNGTTVWDGVFSEAQAARGKQFYVAACAGCHKADLSGYENLLIGDRFMRDWGQDSLYSFFNTVRTTMPRNSPGGLKENVYLDIVSYVLQVNSFPAGAKELTADALPNIRVLGRGGSEAAPDFSLVEVVGCLTQRPDKAWIVTTASEPVRTRNPAPPEGSEQEKAAAKPLGEHTFRLVDVAIYHPQDHNGHKVDAKGFLVRSAGDDTINTTSISTLTSSCTPGSAH